MIFKNEEVKIRKAQFKKTWIPRLDRGMTPYQIIQC